MQTFDVLDPNANVLGRYFLEASAGTGKTFAIENLVPRMLLESKDPITIDQILIVTFTRAATRELKTRIYQNLMKVAQALEDGKGGPKYLEKIFSQGKEALQVARRKVEEACYCFDQAQIFTLHGFALSILQEFAFEAKFFSTSATEVIEQQEELQKYIQDFLRVGLADEVFSATQIKKISQQKQVAKSSVALSSVLMKILEKGQAIRTYKTAKERWEEWNATISSLPRVSLEDLWHDYGLIAPRLVKSKKWESQVQTIFSQIEKGHCSFAEWDSLLQEKELFLGKISFLAKDKEPSYRYPGLFEKIHKLSSLHKEAIDPSVLLLQLASYAKEHYDKGKKDHSCFSPDDFIYQLKEALKEPSFVDKVREKYKALIIDEFQDTDADQWKIFQTLFLEEKSCPTIYLVGDPKQSIYGFRNADVYIYLKAKGFFESSHHFQLGTNFRAHPSLVQALNVLFSSNLPEDWMFLPLSNSSLPLREVAYRADYTSSFQGGKKGRIHFFFGEEKKVKGKQWPSIDLEESSLMPYMAQEILSLKKEQGFLYSQVAVLVKDRYQAERLQMAFSKYGIPCQMQKSLDVKGLAFTSMKELLACLIRPYDISSLKKFLGGALFGCEEEDIQGSWDNVFLQKLREYFTLSARQVKQRGFGVFFSDFLLTPAKNKDKTVAEDLLERKQGEIYFGVRQLCQIMLEYCPEGVSDPKKLFSFLEELQETKPASILQQFFEQEEDQVHVMTLHKSKGLEFDVVFALALGSRYTGKEDHISVRGQEGREIAALDSEEEVILHTEETDAEKLRQLYVALTRAKERVYVPVITGSKGQEAIRGSAAPIELFLGSSGLDRYNSLDVYQKIASFQEEDLILQIDLLGKEASITHEKITLNDTISPFQEEEELLPPLENNATFQEGFSLSFSSLSEATKKEVSSFYLEGVADAEKYDLPLGAETGTIVHEVLEELCKAGLHQEMGASALAVIEGRCRGSLLEGKEEDVFNILKTSLQTPIETEWGSIVLADIPKEEMRLEMEFLYPIGPSLLKGFIDVIFRYRGRYFLLDWKTNALGLQDADYTEEKIEDCMKEHQYDLQAAIYSCAIKKYLALFDKRPFRQIFGGAVYFFLRGKKPYFFYPELYLAKDAEKGDLLWKEE